MTFETDVNINFLNKLILDDEYLAYNYIKKYFIPLTNGTHAILSKDGTDKYHIIDDITLNKVYFGRINGKLKHYYFKEYTKLRTLTCKLNKETLYDNYLNICPKMKYNYEPHKLQYSDFDEKTKSGVNKMLKFIKEVINNDNEECFNYTMKWIANMVQGNKNDSCIYLKGIQGLGKSTLPEFLRDYVIGNDLTLETGSEPLVSRFNGILEAKLMVFFEELENFSTSQWSAISSRLKRYITSSRITIENKGMNTYETENINNYFILSNNDAIKDDDGRRYFICDISTKHKRDIPYFTDLRKSCFNDEVGYAFYYYLMEIDTTNFKAQNYPTTQSKLDSIVKRLDIVYQFLKDEYVLKSKGINRVIVQDLYDEYKTYCNSITKKPISKIDFNKKLKEINIEYYTSDKKNKFNVPFETLKVIANKENWIHILDEITDESEQQEDDLKSKVALLEQSNISKDITIDKLQKQIQELQDLLKQKEQEVEFDEVDIEDETTDETSTTIFDDDDETIITSFDEIFNKINVEDYQWKDVDDDPDVNITDIYKGMDELVYENYCVQKIGYNPNSIEETYKEMDLMNDVASIDEIDNLIDKAFELDI